MTQQETLAQQATGYQGTENITPFYFRVVALQEKLKAPKGQYNNFGKYHYRSQEDILEALKPLLAEYGLLLTISDSIHMVGDRIYVRAEVFLSDCYSDQIISNCALAREAENKKGMDESQITGTASSYARKYALNGLFLIDDARDADTDEHRNQVENTPVPKKKSPKKSAPENDDKKWLNEGTKEWQNAEQKVKSGKIKASSLRDYYKVSGEAMNYFVQLEEEVGEPYIESDELPFNLDDEKPHNKFY